MNGHSSVIKDVQYKHQKQIIYVV
uniref:Uncharacterized protein n=1 Tax=Anguilla anguilla TaxID=7936 RepID=A0A0E9T8A8_ANGAN